ncbi:MAG: hypothetical protein M0C28_27450 [Candidatus Moduliflexus flocculans]|nr:hypothetical protein [Candidatus Moduliflexus flocculans]
MSEKEASLVALVPIKPFTAQDGRPGLENEPARGPEGRSTRLASRALLVDVGGRKEPHYVLPPPMAGFFEFSMMRLRGDLDQKVLAELFYQYINVEEDFIKALFTRRRDPAGPGLRRRAGPVGRERAPRPRLRAGQRGHQDGLAHAASALCYCRHKMEHVGPRLRRPAWTSA